MKMKYCFRPLLCTLLMLNWAKQTQVTMSGGEINDGTCP